MTIVQENGKPQIIGPGSERARLALARAEGDRIVYSLDPSEASQT